MTEIYIVEGSYCDVYYLFGIYGDEKKANDVCSELVAVGKNGDNWNMKYGELDAFTKIIEKYGSYYQAYDIRTGKKEFTTFPLGTDWDVKYEELLY